MRHAPILLAACLAASLVSPSVRADETDYRARDAVADRDAVRQGMRTQRAISDAVEAMTGKVPCDDPAVAPTCRDGRPAPKAADEGSWTDRHLPPPARLSLDVGDAGVTVTVARETRGSWRVPGDTCTLAVHGSVEVLGSDPYLGALVRHLPPTESIGSSRSDCASGTVAFVDWRSMRGWRSPTVAATDRAALGPRLTMAADRIMGTAP